MQNLGKEAVKDPQALKQLLCPLIAQNADGQKKFYEIFDRYYEQEVEKAQEHYLVEGEKEEEEITDNIRTVRRYDIPRWVLPLALTFSLGIASLIYVNIARRAYRLSPKFVAIVDQDTLFSQDTLPLQVTVGQKIQFYNFSRGELGEVEDEIRHNFSWDMGDGVEFDLTENHYRPLSHRFLEADTLQVQLMSFPRRNGANFLTYLAKGAISEMEVHISCPGQRKDLDFRYEPEFPAVGEPVTFELAVEPKDWDYTWEFENGIQRTGEQVSYEFQEGGTHWVELVCVRRVASAFPCADTVLLRKLVTVNWKKEQVSLTPLSVREDLSGTDIRALTGWSIGLLATLLTALVLGALLALRWFTYRILSAERQRKFLPGEEGPFTIPFPSQDYLIAPDRDLYTLARSLRQRQQGELRKLNIPASIRSTIRESGMPVLTYATTSRASEYLVLIEQTHPDSHLARFFSRIMQILQHEDVVLQVYYYDADPRTCWNENHPNGISLAQLRQQYRNYRVILFSQGYSLVDPYQAELRAWVPQAFEVWKNNALIITPEVVKDWGFRERLLAKVFHLLPVDIQGQLNMVELFNQGVDHPTDFDAHKAQLLKAFPAANQSVHSYDLYTLDGLKAYLGESLFQWVAATAVYPLPSWEITLAIGEALSGQGEVISAFPTPEAHLLTYQNLLKLARIPWMQQVDLPPNLRLELLQHLDPSQERIARKTVLNLLEEVKLPSTSLAAYKKSIQEVTHQFMLTPGDKEIAREMYYLIKEELITDGAVKKQMNQPSTLMENSRPGTYLHNRFARVRPLEVLIGAIVGLLLLAVFSTVLHQLYSRFPHADQWPSQLPVKEGVWARKILLQEPSVLLHNRAIKMYQEAQAQGYEDPRVRDSLYRAIEVRKSYDLDPKHLDLVKLRNDYPLARKHLDIIEYNEGVELFNDSSYQTALEKFNNIPLGLADSSQQVILDALRGQGLAWLYLGKRREAQRFADSIRSINPTYANTSNPNLEELLIGREEMQYLRYTVVAGQLLAVEAFDGAILYADSALMIKPGDSLATQIRLDAQQKLASLNEEEQKTQWIKSYCQPGQTPLVRIRDPFFENEFEVARSFLPYLERLISYAEKFNIRLRMGSGFSPLPERETPISIHAGHAINVAAFVGDGWTYTAADFNTSNTFSPSSTQKGPQNTQAEFPYEFTAFLEAVENDPGLRYGGNYPTPAPMHFASNLSQDQTAFQEATDLVQKAYQWCDSPDIITHMSSVTSGTGTSDVKPVSIVSGIKSNRLVGNDIDFESAGNYGKQGFGEGDPRFISISFSANNSLPSTVTFMQSNASTHLIIGREGKVVQMVPFNRQSFSMGKSEYQGLTSLNQHVISIELINAGGLRPLRDGNFSSPMNQSIPKEQVIEADGDCDYQYWQTYTPQQLAAVENVCRVLLNHFEIQEILKQSETAPGRKCGPGPAFPMEELRDKLKSLFATNEAEQKEIESLVNKVFEGSVDAEEELRNRFSQDDRITPYFLNKFTQIEQQLEKESQTQQIIVEVLGVELTQVTP